MVMLDAQVQTPKEGPALKINVPSTHRPIERHGCLNVFRVKCVASAARPLTLEEPRKPLRTIANLRFCDFLLIEPRGRPGILVKTPAGRLAGHFPPAEGVGPGEAGVGGD